MPDLREKGGRPMSCELLYDQSIISPQPNGRSFVNVLFNHIDGSVCYDRWMPMTAEDIYRMMGDLQTLLVKLEGN
jgi:hypothetical protein